VIFAETNQPDLAAGCIFFQQPVFFGLLVAICLPERAGRVKEAA